MQEELGQKCEYGTGTFNPSTWGEDLCVWGQPDLPSEFQNYIERLCLKQINKLQEMTGKVRTAKWVDYLDCFKYQL